MQCCHMLYRGYAILRPGLLSAVRCCASCCHAPPRPSNTCRASAAALAVWPLPLCHSLELSLSLALSLTFSFSLSLSFFFSLSSSLFLSLFTSSMSPSLSLSLPLPPSSCHSLSLILFDPLARDRDLVAATVLSRFQGVADTRTSFLCFYFQYFVDSWSVPSEALFPPTEE